MRVVETDDWLELTGFWYSVKMSTCKLCLSAKFRPVFKILAALPLIAGLVFGGGFISSLGAAESPREHL